MGKGIVFVTDVTRFLGSHIVDVTINAGYRVRACVRRQEQIDEVKSLFPRIANDLEFALIPHFARPDAFQGALDGIDYVIHVASPIPGREFDFRTDYVEPASRGAESILFAAAACPSVKRVVIISCFQALIPLLGSFRPCHHVIRKSAEPETLANFWVDDVPEGQPGQGLRFQFSEMLAHRASQRFMVDRRPHFNLITLHPVFVLGPSLVQRSPDDMDPINELFWVSLESGRPHFPTNYVHVRDVAEAALLSLKAPINRRVEEFVLSGPVAKWEDVVAFVSSNYPQTEVKQQPPFGKPYQVDASKAETILGIRWSSLEDTIRDTLDQQLAFRDIFTPLTTPTAAEPG